MATNILILVNLMCLLFVILATINVFVLKIHVLVWVEFLKIESKKRNYLLVPLFTIYCFLLLY